MSIECFHCSSKIDDSCKFCPQCGNPPQSKICSKCKARVGQDFKFCSECGTPVSFTTGPSGQATSSCFDITIEENDASKRCHLKGSYIFHVSATDIGLLDSRRNVVYNWPRACVRRYGVEYNQNVLVIEVGRKSDSGEGLFRFRTRKAQEIHDLIQDRFMKMCELQNPISTEPSILEQELTSQKRSITSDKSKGMNQLTSSEGSTVPSTTNDANSSEDMNHYFDVSIEEDDMAKRCHLNGKYVIHIRATDIDLLDSRRNVVYSWPFAYIRRYGVKNTDMLVIDVGRKSQSGAGQFSFKTPKAQEIHDLIQRHAIKLIESHNRIPTVASYLKPEVANRLELSHQSPKNLQCKVSSASIDYVDMTLVGTKSNHRNSPPSCGKSLITSAGLRQRDPEAVKSCESVDPLILLESNKLRSEELKKHGVDQSHKEDYMNIKSAKEVQKQDDKEPPLPPRPSKSDEDDSTYVGVCYHTEPSLEKNALENWKLNQASQSLGIATGLCDTLPEQIYDNLTIRKGSENERDDGDKDLLTPKLP